MLRTKLNRIFLVLAGIAVLFLSGCTKKPMDGIVVFTEIQSNQFVNDAWDVSKYNEAHIVAINQAHKTKKPQILTEDFHSACSPKISYDGQNMLFAAKKNAGDPWQIWEMKLGSRKAKQITTFPDDCVSPGYLPGGRFVFSRKLTDAKVGTNYAIFTGNLDGANIAQITFDPSSHGGLSVIADGRILTLSKKEYPEKGENKLMVLRPDGTKLELFYKSNPDEVITSPACEVGEKIWFVETGNSKAGQLISVDYNLPLHTKKVASAESAIEFAGISGYGEGELLASYRSANGGEFSLGLYNTGENKVSELYSHAGFTIVEGVRVQASQRPKNLPSEVQKQETTGLLMCQDVNFTGNEVPGETEKIIAERIEILGLDTTIGTVTLEPDGSFYIKIEADTPFRLQTVSGDGQIIYGPGDWYYIRPNERRACVGCHTGPEITPFNRQPLAVKKSPVILKANEELKINADKKDYEHD